MALDDETVLAYQAMRDLNLLYGAYGAAAQAHAVILRRMIRTLAQRQTRQGSNVEAQRELQQRLLQRLSLAVETDMVSRGRSEQLDRRMTALRGEGRS